ncbi:LuxR family transcriptional regulator [Cupriavidus sp. UYMU48A]|nr:LuxR family transcriptional regulator [Cupriavidus sp. UYMU48A]
MKSKVTAVIADGHPVVLAGLSDYLERSGIRVAAVVDTARDLVSVLQAGAKEPPDIVITGYNYGEQEDGLRLIERIRRTCPQAKIVVFSGVRTIGLIRELFAIGGDAFVSKRMSLQCVLDACYAVTSGAKYVDPSTKKGLVATCRNHTQQSPAVPDSRLSPREREVLRLLARGNSLQEIAEQFQRSIKTISVQKCSAMKKLGLRKELDLAMYLVDPDISY